MLKHVFSSAEKWALITVHGSRCWYGREPVDYLTMEVDHLVPESLAGNPAELERVLVLLGLPSDFDLNSYENWLPVCGPCNRTKFARVFEPTPLIQQKLGEARAGAARARKVAEKGVADRKLAGAIAAIDQAANSGLEFDEGQLAAVIDSILRADPELVRRLMRARLADQDLSTKLSRWTPMNLEEPTAIVRLTPQASLVFMGDRVRLVERMARRP